MRGRRSIVIGVRGRAAGVLVAAAVLLPALLAGCSVSEEEAPPSTACVADGDAIAQALEAAPGDVRLPDGTALSECVRRSESDAELQELALVWTGVAEDLEERAPQDPRAALQLGYLVGAARRGAPSESALQAELVIRLERSAAVDLPPEGERARDRGLRAGQERG